MKFLRNLAIVLLLGSTMIACKKNADTTPKPPTSIEGKYAGKYGFDNEAPDGIFKLNVKTGGVFQELGSSSGNPTGQGTWQLTGDTLTANYYMLFAPYSEYSVSLVFNAAKGTLTGTWGYDKSVSDGGKLVVTKQ